MIGITRGLLFLSSLSFVAASAATKRPNIVFILTDDQDWHMRSLDYMPLLHKYVINEGTLFDKHYCTVSVCCPSRVNLWTGRAAHSTNVTDLFPPYGGYPKFVSVGLNEDWLPVWLQKAGYNTYYTGKLFNSHSIDNYNDPYVKGFNGSDFLLDPYTYEYFNSYMTRNGEPPVSYTGKYSVDVVAEKAYGFLDEAALHDDPFFLGIAPVACHSNVKFTPPSRFDTAFYAERHAHLFKDYKIPRVDNFNPDRPSGSDWVRKLPQLNQTVIEYHDEFQRSRLRSLQAVDEMIEILVQKLAAKGILDNTYIFYTTDNASRYPYCRWCTDELTFAIVQGYHISQHRLSPGKECPYEEDVHIPLVVRGPGVPAGHTAGVVSSHTDLSPTMLKIAGSKGSEKVELDGFPIPLSEEELAAPESGEHVNIEFWGHAMPEGKFGKIGNDSFPNVPGSGFWDGFNIAVRNNTYKTVRVIGDSYNLMYTVWCTGTKEFYDLTRDPHEMTNLLHEENASVQSTFRLQGRKFHHVLNRLNALLMVLKSCYGKECHEPWQTLHPHSKVKTLKDALEGDFDTFYAEQPKVSFSSCEMGYLKTAEGPQNVNAWTDDDYPLVENGKQKSFEYHGPTEWWT